MTKFFLNDTTAESCAASTMERDMTTTQGTPTTEQTDSTSSETFVQGLEYFVTVGTSGVNGGYNVSVEIDAIDADTEVQWRLRRLNSSCTNQPSASGIAEYTTPGIKTDTLTLSGHTWASGDVLNLLQEYRRVPGQHGNKDYTLDINATTSFVDDDPGAANPVAGIMQQHNQFDGGGNQIGLI